MEYHYRLLLLRHQKVMFIKKVIAYIPCHVFYYLGDIVSKIMQKIPDGDEYEILAYSAYDIYNGLMLWSIWWNDFGGLEVWKNSQEEIL